MDDAALVRATRTGDAAAFTAIFDRYAARVHDLALAVLRDRAVALEVVEATFLEASLRLHGLAEEHRLPVWLLAVTRRNAALRAGPTAGPDRQPSLPNDDPDRVRLAGMVWEAVADLPLRDRALLDLDLRHGLVERDLADALGVTPPQAADLQARMRDRIQSGLTGFLVARTANGRCPALDKVVKGWDGRFTPRESRRIADHVERCQTCTQARFALPSPFALYAAALPAPFPAAVRARVIERVVLPVAPGAAMGGPPTPDAADSPATAAYQQPLPASYAEAVPLPDPAPSPYLGAAAPPYPAAAPAPAPVPLVAPSPYQDTAAHPAPTPFPVAGPATVPSRDVAPAPAPTPSPNLAPMASPDTASPAPPSPPSATTPGPGPVDPGADAPAAPVAAPEPEPPPPASPLPAPDAEPTPGPNGPPRPQETP